MPAADVTTRLVFRSRIDAWLTVVVFGPLVYGVWRAGTALLAAPDRADWTALGILTAVTTAILWLYATTAYEITEAQLIIRSGPMRTTVPIADIKRVTPSRTPIAAPALSLRRLEIEYGRWDIAIVSPKDQAGFIEALRQRKPDLEVRGG